MALSQRLDLRQSQSLVMTPQLQQAIKLLQFSSNELREFVESELQQNPMLERDESSDDNRETEDRTLEDTAASNHASTTPETPDDGAPPDSMEHVTGDATSSETSSGKPRSSRSALNARDTALSWSSVGDPNLSRTASTLM